MYYKLPAPQFYREPIGVILARSIKMTVLHLEEGSLNIDWWWWWIMDKF